MLSLSFYSLFTHSVLPDIVAPETLIVKGVQNTIDSDEQSLDLLAFLGGILDGILLLRYFFKMS